MVRTYAFNPSTQSFGESLPCAKLAAPAIAGKHLRNTYNIVAPRITDDHATSPRQQRNAHNARYAAKSERQQNLHQYPLQVTDAPLTKSTSLRQFDTRGNDNPSEKTRTFLPDVHNSNSVGITQNNSKLLPAVANSFSHWNLNLPTVSTVVEDATIILGIRCVCIDGQKFYQPVSLQEQHKKSTSPEEQKIDLNASACSTISMAGATDAFAGRKCRVDADNCSQDSGYQCSLDAPLSEHSKNDSFSTTTGKRNAINDATTIQEYRFIDVKDAESMDRPQRIRNIHAHYKSDYELVKPNSKQHNEMLENSVISLWPTLLDNAVPTKMGWTASSETNISITAAVGDNKFASPINSMADNSNGPGTFYTNSSCNTQSALNLMQFGQSADQREKFAKEQHKLELLRQIEENKRRKIFEKQREWEADERERVKNELYQQRVRREIEEEKRKEREKELLVEKKAQQIAAAQKAAAERLEDQQRQEKSESVYTYANERETIRSVIESAVSEPDEDETTSLPEWWEKKRNNLDENTRTKSPVIPALRTKQQNEISSTKICKTDPADERPLDVWPIDQTTPLPMSNRRRNASESENQRFKQDVSHTMMSDTISYGSRPSLADSIDNYGRRTGDVPSWRSRSFVNSAKCNGNVTPPHSITGQCRQARHRCDNAICETTNNSFAAQSRRAKSFSRQQRRNGYQPTIEQNVAKCRDSFYASDSDNGEVNYDERGPRGTAMRRLSGTHRSLQRESMRIRDALRVSNYGAHLFND